MEFIKVSTKFEFLVVMHEYNHKMGEISKPSKTMHFGFTKKNSFTKP